MSSTRFQIGWLDIYSTLRDIAMLLLSAVIANIEIFRTQLSNWGVQEFWATLIVWTILELGRRFITDYTKK